MYVFCFMTFLNCTLYAVPVYPPKLPQIPSRVIFRGQPPKRKPRDARLPNTLKNMAYAVR